MSLLDTDEFDNPERSFALRLFYALMESNESFKMKYSNYQIFHETYFSNSEKYNLRTIMDWLVEKFPPQEFGLIHVQFDETNFILNNAAGIRYLVQIIKELNASWTFSKKLFICALFSGTFSAALHDAVMKSASKMVPVSLTPLTLKEYQLSISMLLGCEFVPESWFYFQLILVRLYRSAKLDP